MNRKLVAVTGALMLSLGACTPASYNLSNDSDNFRVMRRAVFVNGITDKYIGNGEFVVTEEWLVEVFSQPVSMNEAIEELGVDE